MPEKVYVTWDDVEQFVNELVDIYKDNNLPGVLGPARGGLILAVMLSHRLHIPMLNAPCKGCLIVDDICDTGESLIHYYKNSSALDKPLYHIVTMYYKENTLGVIPELSKFNKEDKWIVFPWEDKEE